MLISFVLSNELFTILNKRPLIFPQIFSKITVKPSIFKLKVMFKLLIYTDYILYVFHERSIKIKLNNKGI